MAAYVQPTLAYVAVSSRTPDAGGLLRRSHTRRREGSAQHDRRGSPTSSEGRSDHPQVRSLDVTSIGARSPWRLTYLAEPPGPPRGQPGRSGSRRDSASDADAPAPLASTLRYELNSSIGPHKVAVGRLLSCRDRGYLRHPQATSHKSIAEAYSGCGRSWTRSRPALGISSRGRGPRAHDRHRRSEHDPGDEYSASCPRVAGSSTYPPRLQQHARSGARCPLAGARSGRCTELSQPNGLLPTTVLEEPYVDDLSPGYLHHDSDLIWLDSELVSSRSNGAES